MPIFIFVVTTLVVGAVEIILFHWMMGRDAGGLVLWVMGGIAMFAGQFAMMKYVKRGE
ncbi:hypothetical protein [Ruegeria sediminis]|uniref:hypothetical protein n=1 Tax=Ruegeria sediminis TaxID=2583820 RepID=UPI001487515B|nr:hypothetical protein [Ruegeria sediminis]